MTGGVFGGCRELAKPCLIDEAGEGRYIYICIFSELEVGDEMEVMILLSRR